LIKLSRRGSKDKKWITANLKKSSNQKNMLYNKWIKSENTADEDR